MTAAALACLAVGYGVAFVGAVVGALRSASSSALASLETRRNPLHGL